MRTQETAGAVTSSVSLDEDTNVPQSRAQGCAGLRVWKCGCVKAESDKSLALRCSQCGGADVNTSHQPARREGQGKRQREGPTDFEQVTPEGHPAGRGSLLSRQDAPWSFQFTTGQKGYPSATRGYLDAGQATPKEGPAGLPVPRPLVGHRPLWAWFLVWRKQVMPVGTVPWGSAASLPGSQSLRHTCNAFAQTHSHTRVHMHTH